MFVGAGWSRVQDTGAGEGSDYPAVLVDAGLGTSPVAPLVIGAVLHGSGHIGFGSDWGGALRLTTGGYSRGDWGLGLDVGPQYRSVIFVHSDDQRRIAEDVIREFDADGGFGAPIVTEVQPFERFWPAEPEHLDYYRRNPMQPYCAFVISPKVAKVRRKYASRLKADAK